MKLEIARCPTHKSFWAIIVHGRRGGRYRLTPSKCCGRWQTIKIWSNLRLHDVIADLKREAGGR